MCAQSAAKESGLKTSHTLWDMPSVITMATPVLDCQRPGNGVVRPMVCMGALLIFKMVDTLPFVLLSAFLSLVVFCSFIYSFGWRSPVFCTLEV